MVGYSFGRGSWVSPENPDIADKTYSPSVLDYSLEELEDDVFKEFDNAVGSPELAAEVYRELTYEVFKEGHVTGEDVLDRKTAGRFVDDWS